MQEVKGLEEQDQEDEPDGNEEINARTIPSLRSLTTRVLFELHFARVDVSFRGLNEVPLALFELANITFLNLDFNQIKALPEQISYLSCLEKLHVNNNQLETLPFSIGELTCLKELELYNNHLKYLPSSIGKLASLRELVLNQNEIHYFPKECCLPKLKGLNLDHNCLESLPNEIGKMSSLEWLFLDDNRISEIPEQIGCMTSLEQLFLSDNNISKLPQQIQNLTSLHRLFVKGNPVTCQTSVEFGDVGFHVTSIKVPSLKSLCAKYLLDNQIQTIILPNDLQEYLTTNHKCFVCTKYYLEPEVEGFGMSEFEWHMLPFYYNLCSYKCSSILRRLKISQWKGKRQQTNAQIQKNFN